MKSVLVLILVSFATVSARSYHHQNQKQEGRTVDIVKSLNKAGTHTDALKNPEKLSQKELTKHFEKLEKHLSIALSNAEKHPLAIDIAKKLAKEKAEGHHEALAHHLKEAEKHEDTIKQQGRNLNSEDLVREHEGLQHHLSLANHHAKMHKLAIHDSL